jgi:hypothetical protein
MYLCLLSVILCGEVQVLLPLVTRGGSTVTARVSPSSQGPLGRRSGPELGGFQLVC